MLEPEVSRAQVAAKASPSVTASGGTAPSGGPGWAFSLAGLYLAHLRIGSETAQCPRLTRHLADDVQPEASADDDFPSDTSAGIGVQLAELQVALIECTQRIMLRQSVELLTTAQVARRLKQSEEVVRRKARSGELPAFRLGSGPRAPLRFDAAELTEWLYREPARGSAIPSRARAVPAERRAPTTGQSITRQPVGPLEAV